MKPPAPLLTDTTLPTRLTLHLDSVARARFPYDQERGLIALQDALGRLDVSSVEHAAAPHHAPIGSASVGSSLVVGSTIKVVLITAVSLMVWGVWSQWRADHSPRPPTVRSVAAIAPVAPAQVAATPAPDDAPIPPTGGSAELSPPPSSTTLAPVRPAVAKAPAPRLAQGTEGSRARREIAQLNQIKRTLPADPATALRLARYSAREFPQGLLREEREALIVLALWQLGEVAAARAGAEQFLARHPRSSFRARIQECMAP
jgi:hypothetical protein